MNLTKVVPKVSVTLALLLVGCGGTTEPGPVEGESLPEATPEEVEIDETTFEGLELPIPQLTRGDGFGFPISIAPNVPGESTPLDASSMPMSVRDVFEMLSRNPSYGRFFTTQRSMDQTKVEFGYIVDEGLEDPEEYLGYLVTGGESECVQSLAGGGDGTPVPCYGLAIVDADSKQVTRHGENGLVAD